VVSRHGYPDCMVLVKPFVRLHEVENPLLEVVKHTDLHCLDEVGLREVTHKTGNMSRYIESSVNIARLEFGIPCRGVGLAERSK